MPAAPPRTPERIKDVNTRYHDAAADAYDAKWGIDFGAIGQEQVRAQAAQGARRPARRPFGDALEIGAGTGYFSLNLLQLGMIERATATDISPGMLRGARGDRRRARRRGRDRRRPTPRSCPSRTRASTSSSATPSCTTSPTSSGPSREFRRVLRPGGARRLLRRALALRRPARRAAEARRRWPPRRSGAARSAPAARAPTPEAEQSTTATRSRARSTSTPSPRPTCGAMLARRRLRAIRGSRGEELLANVYGWGLRTLESTAEPDQVSERWRRFAFRSYIALQRVDTAPARAAPARRALLQPRALGRKPA